MNNFLPSVGRLDRYRLPEGEGIRVDNGFEEGMDIPIYYDPMIAKLVTYGKTRGEALQLMLAAISSYEVSGVETTLPFGRFVFEHEAFRNGNFDTHFVQKHFSSEKLQETQEQEARLAALVALKQYLKDQKQLRLPH